MLGKLRVEIESAYDSKGITQARQDVGKFAKTVDSSGVPATKSMSQGFGNLSKKASQAGGTLTARVSLPLVALGGFAFKAASDMNESISKADVVFGDFADGIVEGSDRAAKAMGIAKQEYLESAATIGNLFRAMGSGKADAAKMSADLVGLSSDLASFNNASPEDVLLALRSGLVGEAEPMRKFGVSLSAARVEAEAFAIGLAKPVKNALAIREATLKVDIAQRKYNEALKTHGENSLEARKASVDLEKSQAGLTKSMKGQKVELTAAQKAQAAYSIIMKDTKLAQGDFAKTATGAANQTRILKAEFKDTAATLGSRLLPVGTKVLGFVGGLVKKMGELSPQMQNVVIAAAGIAIALGPVMKIVGVLGPMIGFLLSPIGLIVAALVGLGIAFALAWKKSAEFREGVRSIVEKVGPAFKAMGAQLISTFKTIWSVVQPIIAKIIGTLAPLFKVLVPLWAKLWVVQMKIIGAAFKVLGPVINAVVSVIVALVKGVVTVVARMANAIIHTINGVIRAINLVKPGKDIRTLGTVDVEGMFWSDSEKNRKGQQDEAVGRGGREGKINSFAKGGVVGGPIGMPQLAIVHGGEKIRPVGSNNDGVSVSVNVYLDGEQIFTNVRTRLSKQSRRAPGMGLA